MDVEFIDWRNGLRRSVGDGVVGSAMEVRTTGVASSSYASTGIEPEGDDDNLKFGTTLGNFFLGAAAEEEDVGEAFDSKPEARNRT
jgi:hypothetical protein